MLARAAVLGGILVTAAGCPKPQVKKGLQVRYPDRGQKQGVPDVFKGSVLELADLEGTEPLAVSGWGLVVNLRGTGDSTASTAVREYMINEMVRHGFGTTFVPGYKNMRPEEMLRQSSVAIVRVDGLIPPGARVGQTSDALVSVVEGNNTSSLAHGTLYQTDLRIDGADAMKPTGKVTTYARVGQGQIFVNPVYAVKGTDAGQSSDARASLRYGVVLDATRSMLDRALILRVRRPQYSMSRAIETAVNTRFQNEDMRTARAQDEAIIELLVPKSFNGDWEHFAGVVTHLFLNNSSAFVVTKARQLAEAAVKPDAPLMDISYAWEALGPGALEYVQPLMTNPSPAVAYAAARAAAFLGDVSAQQALVEIARQAGNPFQINAVQALGALPDSPAVSSLLRQLLDTDQTLVRIEAYKVLARHKSPLLFSKVIGEKFVLDFVPCDGPPLVYASRSGIPRIAIFGTRARVPLPLTFTTMDRRLSLSSNAGHSDILTLFYRSDTAPPVQQLSRPDLGEIVARLGGEGAPGEKRFDFSYGDIVGILQGLSSADKIVSSYQQRPVSVAFVLQEMPASADPLNSAPVIGEASAATQPIGKFGAAALPELNPAETGGVGGNSGRPQ
jgi:flagellar basal body P-ring protein FlgI